MNSFYTILAVAAMFAVLIPVGKRVYPNGSGSAFPAWVNRLPNSLLLIVGVIAVIFGLVATWVSGQVLFGAPVLFSMDSWWPLIGVSAGVLISLHGFALFGTVLLKKRPESL